MSVITKAMNVVYSVILMQIVGLAWAYQVVGTGINPYLALMAVTILWLANVWWRAAADNNPCDGCKLSTCAGCHKSDALWGSLYDANPCIGCPHDDCATCESEHIERPEY